MQQYIQSQILQIAQRKEFITYLDIQHLGSKQQTDRARTALKNAQKLKNAGTVYVNGGTYTKMQATQKRPISKQEAVRQQAVNPDAWPCGTPRSKNNAFNWRMKLV